MSNLSNRFFALLIVPAMALSLSACGPKPETTTTATSPAAMTTPAPGTETSPAMAATPAPGGEMSPAASPGMGGAVPEEIVAFVEALPAAKGKDGKLSLNAAEGPMLIEIVAVEKAAANKTPDGKSNVPAKLKNDKGAEMVGEFMIVGETKDAAVVDSLIIVQDGNRTTYIWSEEKKAFEPGVAGAPGADMGASPAPAGDMPAGDAPAGDMPAGDAPAGDMPASPAPGETPAQ